MIEIICNEENSDKSKQVTRGAAIRRPKNIKQIGEVSSDKKIYIEDYAFTYINSIAYNNPSDSQAEKQIEKEFKLISFYFIFAFTSKPSATPSAKFSSTMLAQ